VKEIEKLLLIMRSLRDKNNGCPWDLAQTHTSLASYAVEEAYEVVAAIEDGIPQSLCDELGDLLFQVVFHAQLAAEQQQFEFGDVVNAICEKMTLRHPHVFAADSRSKQKVLSLQEHNTLWEQSKRESRDKQTKQVAADAAKSSNKSILDGIAGTFPATTIAMKLQKRAASVGFDWKTITPIYDKVVEELEEVRVEVSQNNQDATEDELGDLLFAVINLSRHAGVEPESALRRANRKFERRFREVERITEEQKQTMSTMSESQLEAVWAQVKKIEHCPKGSE